MTTSILLCSQYTHSVHAGSESSPTQNILYSGNNAKSLFLSIKYSLRNLRTDYIDLLYIHWWEWDTSIEEVMGALHNLVLQGKVLYLVCAIDFPNEL